MAQYNADIRVGITGKTQLNALEKQLGRINKDLNQINKNLKAQTLTINTKGATRALDQLDRKISKLNRSINVNARINEKRTGSGGSGGGGGFNAAALASVSRSAMPLSELKQREQISKQMLKDAKERIRDGDKVQAESKKILDTYNELANTAQQLDKAQAAYTDKTQKLADLTRQRNAALGQAKGLQTRLTKGQIKNADAVKRAKVQMAEYKALASDLSSQIGNANKGFGNQNKLLEKATKLNEKRIAQEKNLETLVEKTAKKQIRREKFNKGFGTGLGVAGASAAGNIPVLGDAVTGGLVASLSGGSVAAGALAGGLVGVGVALVGVTADVTKFNNELLKQQRALANTVSTSEELEAAFAAIERASDDFLVPIGEATAQFTKLNAAARASGFTVEEVEEVYRGLAAANTALGGNQERLQGILLATQQVFSKGKVQAEELRGQIGERLAGAFAKFAESAGLSTSELDKALERGEVSLEDFVRFSKSLLEDYEDEAKKIADAPENAAERLKLSMDDLRRAMGPIVTDIGNMFIEMANTVVAQLTRLFDFINKARTEAARTQAAADRANLQNVRADLQKAQDNFQKNKNPITEFEFNRQSRAVALAMENVRGSAKVLNDITKTSLDATADPLKPRTTPDPLNDTKKKGGGGSGSGPRDTTAELQAAIAAQRVLLQLEQERFGLTERELELRSFDDSARKVRNDLEKELSDIQRDNITAESKALASTLAELEAKTDLQQIENERQQYHDAIATDIQQQITDLETQIKVEEAITEEMKEQAILAARIAEIQNGPGEEGDKQRLIDAENALKKARDGNQGISGYMKQLQSELMDTEGMIVSLAQTVQSELGNAMSSALTGLIDGTKTAQEAFADMFANIGKAFIDMATQMIAKALVMKALGILTGGTGGGSGAGWGGAPQLSNIARIGYAEGGFVTGPTQAMIGEAGEPEYVIGSSKMNSAMARYSQGMRGEAVTAGASEHGGDAEGGTGEGGASAIDVSYSVSQINSVNYVTEESFQRGMSEAAARGAKAGEARALGRLRTSVGVRSKLGLS